MVLRVSISIVPFGDESKSREIRRFDIFNKGKVSRTACSYGVIDLDFEKEAGGLFSEDVTHFRDEGAAVLVQRVLEKLELFERLADTK